MNGKFIAGFLVLTGLVAGIAMYWLQVYAFYDKAVFIPGQEMLLTSVESGSPETILVEKIEGIDSDSSPIRFRACFKTPLTQVMLTKTYKIYSDPTPLTAPSWFGCFDAAMIGAALENGEAIAFLGQSEIQPDVDRVVAVFADGRGYAWNQLNGLEGNE
ncbi:MAG: histidine kinase [Rhodobacteraceae bacterium]|nr:histidine kinase [Paracoccaceae bacterium]